MDIESQQINVRTAKLRSFFSMFMVAVPVLVPYWHTLGLSVEQALNLQAIFGLSVAIFEIPTGYVADIWGRKASLLLGGFITACAFSYLPFADSYETLILFEVTVALGSALSSGSDIAILYDSLEKDANNSEMIGSINHFSLLGEALACLLASMLVIHSFDVILWVQALALWIPFFAAFSFIEPPIEKMQSGKHIGNIGLVFSHIFIENKQTRLIFINCIAWGLSSFCVVWLLQPYWEIQKIDIFWFGILWAVHMLISAYFSKYAHKIEKEIGTKQILLLLAICPCMAYFIMSAGFFIPGLLAGILFYINRGLASAILVDLFNYRIKSSYRATANSISSLSFRLGFALLGPLIGMSVSQSGMLNTLFILGLIFSMLLIILMLPLTKSQETR